MSTYPHKCFIRVSGFDNGTPRPANPPGQAEDHLEAYERFIFATKEDAVKDWLDEINHFCGASPSHVRDFVHEHWPDDNYVCICYVAEDGTIDCTKRVVRLSGPEKPERMNLDEDFLITFERADVFQSYLLEDDFALRSPTM